MIVLTPSNFHQLGKSSVQRLLTWEDPTWSRSVLTWIPSMASYLWAWAVSRTSRACPSVLPADLFGVLCLLMYLFKTINWASCMSHMLNDGPGFQNTHVNTAYLWPWSHDLWGDKSINIEFQCRVMHVTRAEVAPNSEWSSLLEVEERVQREVVRSEENPQEQRCSDEDLKGNTSSWHLLSSYYDRA